MDSRNSVDTISRKLEKLSVEEHKTVSSLVAACLHDLAF